MTETSAPMATSFKPGQVHRTKGRFPAFMGLARHTGGFYVQDLDEPMSLDAALSAAGLDFEVKVSDIPVAALVAWSEGVTEVVHPKYRLSYGQQSTDSEPFPLGVVGKTWTPVQDHDAFAFGQRLIDNYGANVVAAGKWGDPIGSRTYMAFKLPESFLIGGEDQVDVYGQVVNGHDGSLGLSATVGPIQLSCTNQLPSLFGRRGGNIVLRHTRNVNVKMDQASLLMGLGTKWYDGFQPIAEKLLATPMTDADFVTFMSALWGEADPEAPTRTRNSDQRRRGTLHRLFREGTNPVGRGTGYAALNAVTEYADWEQNYRGGDAGRYSRLADGAAEKIKVSALNLLAAG